MHEMGIALQIIDIASSALPDDVPDGQVETLNLKIGKLTAVVPESLRFCFNVASRDTRLAGARLNLEEIPVVVHCGECGSSSTIEKPPFVCSTCGNGGIEIVSGRELMVVSIELADEGIDTSTQE